MAFTFLAQIPNTPVDDSPTVWRDDATGDLMVQGYRATGEDYALAAAAGSTPGHSTAVPDHETMVRLPASIIPALKAALG